MSSSTSTSSSISSSVPSCAAPAAPSSAARGTVMGSATSGPTTPGSFSASASAVPPTMAGWQPGWSQQQQRANTSGQLRRACGQWRARTALTWLSHIRRCGGILGRPRGRVVDVLPQDRRLRRVCCASPRSALRHDVAGVEHVPLVDAAASAEVVTLAGAQRIVACDV
eukprot:scaffold5951_cov108-Isochrysis_galbana.AAC.1